MAFPTIPTGGRILTVNQLDSSGTRTFPNLSSLTKNSGDLLIAIIITYQSNTNPQFSSWGGGFTEFTDQGTSTTLGIGAAYKWSTGSETGTFTVTQAATITGDASMILMSIPGAHATTPPEAGTIANNTAAAADPGSFNPSGWGTEDTLWLAVTGNGMTSGSGTWTATGASAPTNFGSRVDTNASDTSTIGDVEAAVSFRQQNAASQDVGTESGQDVSNARNSALCIAVRPAPATLERSAAIDAAVDVASSAQFWTTFERSSAIDASVGVASSGTFWTTFERAAALDAAVSIASSAQFFTVFERAAAIDAALTTASSGTFFSVFERAVALDAALNVASAPQRELLRSSAFNASVDVASSALFFSVFERAAAFDAAVAIASDSERIVERAAAFDAALGIFTSAVVEGGFATHERAAAFDAAVAIASSGVFWTTFERAAAFDAALSIASSAQFFSIFERSAAFDIGGGVASVPQRDLLRSSLLDMLVSISSSGEFSTPGGPTVHQRAAAIDIGLSIASAGQFWSILERSALINMNADIASAPQRDLHRSAAFDAEVLISTVPELVFAVIERAASFGIELEVGPVIGAIQILLLVDERARAAWLASPAGTLWLAGNPGTLWDVEDPHS